MTPARHRDRWLEAAFVVCALATVLPIWIAKYLPLLDLPNHLAAVAVWHYHDDPKWDFQRFYDLNLVPLPYWAHYYTVHLLTYVTRSVEVANKIFLTGYALARTWVRFDRRAASFRRLMRRVERGSSTLVLVMGDAADPSVDPL
ncbi:MAG TPA: hypothetical protein VF334_03295, partial [Polyangia bacterium]